MALRKDKPPWPVDSRTTENLPAFYDQVEGRGDRRARNMIVSPHAGYQREYVYRDWDPLNDGIDDKVCDGSNIINPGLRSGSHPDLPCFLCNLTNVGPVHFVCDEYIIINCPICKLKLLVLSAHTMNMSTSVYGRILSRLNAMYRGFRLCRDSEYNHFNVHIFTTDNDKEIFVEWHVKRRGFEEYNSQL
jgi:hypothetical protein